VIIRLDPGTVGDIVTIATLADVATSMLRTLTENELHYAPSLLARSEALLEALVPDMRERCADSQYRHSVASVEADMLARVLRNPGGLLSESEGDYRYRLDSAVASGQLRPTAAELRSLGGTSQVRVALGDLDGYARRRFPTNGTHPFLSGG
jgi:hypothetical protein